jgi:hypothetical protein
MKFEIGVVHQGINKNGVEFRFGVAKPTFTAETKTWKKPPENANIYTEDPAEFDNVAVGNYIEL